MASRPPPVKTFSVSPGASGPVLKTELPAFRAKRFLLGWAAMILFLVVIVFPAGTMLLLNWKTDGGTRWVGQIWQRKLCDALRCQSQPRLLIAGGSSGFFSVDAELLETRLSMPCVNIATHAGLGLRYLLADIRQVAQPSDTVVLYLEYQNYSWKNKRLSDLERKVLWTYKPMRLLSLPPRQALESIYGNPFTDYVDSWSRIEQSMQIPPKGPPRLGYQYVTLGFRGDFRSSLPPGVPPAPFNLTAINSGKDASAELRAFFKWCDRHHVHLIAAGPGMLRSRAGENPEAKRAYDSFHPLYEQAKIPVLDTWDVFQLPKELFFDTPYHATAAGRRIITETLARELVKRIGPGGAKAPQSAPILLLGSAEGGAGRQTILASRGRVDCRFLSANDLEHPLCTTPDGVLKLLAANREVYFSDPEVGRLLAGAGIPSEPSETRTTELKDWVHAFPNHLFAFASVDRFDTAPLAAGLPVSFAAFLNDPAPCKTAILGTGCYQHIQMVQSAQEEFEVRRFPYEPWQRKMRFPMEWWLRTGAWPLTAIAPIAIERQPINLPPTALPADATSAASFPAGLAVVVVDPENGSVIKHGYFTGPTYLDWEVRQVRAGSH